MSWSVVGSIVGPLSGPTTFSLTPGGVGDLILLEVINTTGSGGGTASALSSSNATWATFGSSLTGSTNNGWTSQVFAGTVTSTSTQTVTITWSGTAPSAHVTVEGYEFASTVGSWAFDTSGHIDSSGTNSWPTLTPAGSGELYFGYALNAGTATGGGTSGFTYHVDANGNGAAYNLNVSSATAPLWGDSGQAFGIMVLVKETASAAVWPPSRARRTAARTPALPPVRRYRQMLPVPAQLNPPYPFTEIVQHRQTWPRGLPRRGHVSNLVPPQLNPPYPFAEIRQWRQPRGFFPRRGHQVMPVPAQQAAAPNPAFTFQNVRHQRVLYLRRGHVFTPVPGQEAPVAELVQRRQEWPRGMSRRGRRTQPVPAQVTVAAPAWVQGHRSPGRAIALLRRRFRQLMPWPQAVAPAFSVGTLTASDAALGTLTATTAAAGTLATATAPAAALSAADATLATLTAADKRTGGPS